MDQHTNFQIIIRAISRVNNKSFKIQLDQVMQSMEKTVMKSSL